MSVLSAAAEQQVEDVLVSSGMLTADKLTEARQAAEKAHVPVISYLVKNNYISDEQLTKANAKVTQVPYVNLTAARIDPKVLGLLPQDIAERYMAVPLGEMQHRLVVAMLDADNVQAVDFLSNRIARPLKVYVASEAGIRQVLRQYDARLDTKMGKAFGTDLSTGANEADASGTDKSKSSHTIANLVEDSPISKALSAILEFAARNRASDVHIEPMEKEVKIRCRVDGVLREVMRLPKNTEPALISRVKILANLKIDEHRTPQDGQFSIRVDDKDVDLRIAIAPIVWGEQVVIRLLDKSGTSLMLEDMGYTGRALRTIRKGVLRPNGMILTSGPTGSGKSTSMYALIQEIKNDSINIVTLEDPVEYKIDGINQIQVNSEVGLTFATGLRSILRQDPDVVMVGEIRDKETAQLAVQAALTGHLVFSTLHTNSAAGILPRLLDMGVEPFLIASTVHTVIGQRLVRRIADTGKQTYQSSPAETEAIRQTIGSLLPAAAEQAEAAAKDLGYKSLPLNNQTAYTLTKGTDNPDNPGGYRGRMGLYEVFEVSEAIQGLIMKRATSSQIERAAKAEGMVNMRQDGYLKCLDGRTTLAEVNRVAAEDIE
ncbi:MAG TPA: GspE/PulE family protein [Verrucomicrobiae bacterium]|jgi:type IV pilus assembly protein PilB|nr:GspE/PulE family protein [Verrucomicrobiae bacterium]